MANSATHLSRPPVGLHALVKSPYTLGGDVDLRVLKLDDTHLRQRDKSQNRAIWDLFDLDKEFDHAPAPSAGLPVSVEEQQMHEKEILARKYALLKHISALMGSTCSHVSYLRPERLMRMKMGGCIEPLPYAVGNGLRDKLIGNQTFQNGDYGAAVRTYVVALTDLAPWYASPLLFTGQQVVDSGLLSLEPVLWSNLSLCLYKLAHKLETGGAALAAVLLPLVPPQATRTRYLELLHAAELAALQVVSARYVSSDLLKKAYHHYARALQARVERVKPKDRSEWNKIIEELNAASKKIKGKDGLAHAECKEEHVCLA